MSTAPECLDLFCGGGGATRGYQRAGYRVTGVDLHAQPRYCGDAFVRGDALDYVARHGHRYDLIHASPPCQHYSATRSLHNNVHPDLVPATRAALQATGKPYVIENVVGAPLIDPLMLCGQMFGLSLYRHRLFECTFYLLAPPHPPHRERTTACSTQRWGEKRHNPIASVTGHAYLIDHGRRAMGIDWMVRRELSQAIPPAYTEYIARAYRAAYGG